MGLKGSIDRAEDPKQPEDKKVGILSQNPIDFHILAALEGTVETTGVPPAYECFAFTHFRHLAKSLDSSPSWDSSTECFFYSNSIRARFAISGTYDAGDYGLAMVATTEKSEKISVYARYRLPLSRWPARRRRRSCRWPWTP